jgi:hypothetical protein
VPRSPEYVMSPTYSIFHMVPLSDLNWDADGSVPVGRLEGGLVFDDGAGAGGNGEKAAVVFASGAGFEDVCVVIGGTSASEVVVPFDKAVAGELCLFGGRGVHVLSDVRQ